MSYDKSDGSSHYNRNERGGWYCTNPKKHDDANQHHDHNQDHDHRPNRNEGTSSRYERQPGRNERTSSSAQQSQRTNTAQQSQRTGSSQPFDGKWRPMSTTSPRQSHQTQPEGQQRPLTTDGNTPTPQSNKRSSGCGCAITAIAVYFVFRLLAAIFS